MNKAIFKKGIKKLCYLVCLEKIFDNGVMETAVFNLLTEFKKQSRLNTEIYLMVVFPIIHISKKGIVLNFIKYKAQINSLKKRLSNQNISLIIAPSFMLRFGIYLPILSLFLFCLLTLPLILAVFLYKRFDIIHCRSYLSALLAIIAKKSLINTKVIFDLRGLYPEEGIIQGKWSKNSLSFLLWKKIESYLLKYSDAIVTLSDTFSTYIGSITKNNKIYTICFGTNTDAFAYSRRIKNDTRKQLGLDSKMIFTFNGGLGSWQDPNLLARIFSCIKNKIRNSYLLIFTNFDKKELERTLSNYHILSDSYKIMNVPFADIVLYLPACDYGIAPSRDISIEDVDTTGNIFKTMIGTKIAEYLSSGLPIIVNENIGGIIPIMSKREIGIKFNSSLLDNLPSEILEVNKKYTDISDNCIKTAKEFFSLRNNAKSYFNIYNDLIGNN